jgi:hypothetical protein
MYRNVSEKVKSDSRLSGGGVTEKVKGKTMAKLFDWMLEKKIEKALMARFPGSKIKFTINTDRSWDCVTLPGSKERFDEQYPGMTREQADAQIIVDMRDIISQHMPNADFSWFERYGQRTHFEEGA